MCVVILRNEALDGFIAGGISFEDSSQVVLQHYFHYRLFLE